MTKLLSIALLTDLLIPVLSWKAGVPAELRWVSHAAMAAIILHGLVALSGPVAVPRWLLVVFSFSIIGSVAAAMAGQGLAATLWGWWLMFKFPLIALCAYLRPSSMKGFLKVLRPACIVVLALQVAAQIVLYLTGVEPGDGLAGTLGPSATSHLALVISLALALELGDWLAGRGPSRVVLVMALGVISSALGEIKLFAIVVAVMGTLALIGQGVLNHRMLRTVPYMIGLAIAIASFSYVYDAVVPRASSKPLSSFLGTDLLDQYLGSAWRIEGSYNVGRNYALSYVWDRVSSNPLTLAIGEGLGARGESKTMDSVGMGILGGDLGLFAGTSLVVILGELGLMGWVALTLFFLWVARRLWQDARLMPDSSLCGTRYGLLLYTLMWPVWLWYTTAWTWPVPSLIYWAVLGYCLARGHQASSPRETLSPPIRPLRRETQLEVE